MCLFVWGGSFVCMRVRVYVCARVHTLAKVCLCCAYIVSDHFMSVEMLEGYSSSRSRVYLALVCQNALITTISTTLCDAFPRVLKLGQRPLLLVIFICYTSFLVGLIMTTEVRSLRQPTANIAEKYNNAW